ncbi:MAG: hypothetical protein JO280_09395 [Mycobacteriaceae bacterium]|nr:hypothetical protein [Mycobacteriaceae bacterium]
MRFEPVEGAKELTLGMPPDMPSNDPASLRRLWVSATNALGSAPADNNFVVSAISGPIPERPGLPSPVETPELDGSAELGVPRVDGSAALGVPRVDGSAELGVPSVDGSAALGVPGADSSAGPAGTTEFGSVGVGANEMSVGAVCDGAASAVPMPNPDADSASAV